VTRASTCQFIRYIERLPEAVSPSVSTLNIAGGVNFGFGSIPPASTSRRLRQRQPERQKKHPQKIEEEAIGVPENIFDGSNVYTFVPADVPPQLLQPASGTRYECLLQNANCHCKRNARLPHSTIHIRAQARHHGHKHLNSASHLPRLAESKLLLAPLCGRRSKLSLRGSNTHGMGKGAQGFCCHTCDFLSALVHVVLSMRAFYLHVTHPTFESEAHSSSLLT
jgi:hypothetical protein